MNREHVIRFLAQAQRELHERYVVKTLALFGSVARNEGRVDSDVDLLIEFSQQVG
jgi:predicted nucleotidyltransferase